MIAGMPAFSDHPLFVNLQEPIISCPIEDLSFADEVFARFIFDMFEKTNRDYFLFIVKFVILFRESINTAKGNDYTRHNNADLVPELCDGFIIDFMEQYDNFELDSNELISIIMHFCNWLYENKCTSVMLTLCS
jgi:hypothetical protein